MDPIVFCWACRSSAIDSIGQLESSGGEGERKRVGRRTKIAAGSANLKEGKKGRERWRWAMSETIIFFLYLREGGGWMYLDQSALPLSPPCVCVAKKETRHDPAGMSNTAFARRLRLQWPERKPIDVCRSIPFQRSPPSPFFIFFFHSFGMKIRFKNSRIQTFHAFKHSFLVSSPVMRVNQINQNKTKKIINSCCKWVTFDGHVRYTKNFRLF